MTKNCNLTSVGFIPLTELGGNHKGATGFLYPGGNNVAFNHLEKGLEAASRVKPLDKQGNYNPSGKIVFASIGMSNTRKEFAAFIPLARNAKWDRVRVLNAAKANYDAPTMANPNSDYWIYVDRVLTNNALTPPQLQVVWLKQAVRLERDSFPLHVNQLKDNLKTIVTILKNRYHNLQQVFISSRIYAGYGGPNVPSAEPWAYEGGFATKWLIQEQIEVGDYDNLPWLAWGPYLWADGLTPRLDGLVWRCEDFATDGMHPSTIGSGKVATMLLNFFSDNETTKWFNNR